jgi:hypothetical protein
MNEAPRELHWPAWVALGVWTALIFASIPTIRILQGWVAARFGSALFGYGVMAAVVAGLAWALVLLGRARGRIALIDLAWLAGIAIVYVWWTRRLWGQPEEAVHFVEYGVLGVLAWRAIRQRTPDAAAHLAAALLGTLIGTCDEIVQWVVPSRFFDLRDVALNAGSSALVQLALRRIVSPSPPARPQSLRLAARLAAAELALLTLCLAATPARVERLVTRFPSLAFLAHTPEAMAEYGHLYNLPSIGRFRSRFTLEELERLDSRRAAEAGALLDQYPDPRYGEFLARYTPVTDPFLHEARVHLFSRDRNRHEAEEQLDDPRAARELMTTAFRENELLETCFGHTLASSHAAWSELERGTAEALALADRRFESRVGASLITLLSEGQLRSFLLVAVAGLLLVDRWLGWRLRRGQAEEG